MPAIHTIGTIIRIVARTIRAAVTSLVALSRLLGRGVLAARRRGAGGETGMVRLLDLHAASCAGDTLVAIGLAGTIFFAVPANEARGRVALYLLVTMLPFALLAPVAGPVLDRFRHGRRYALAVTMLGRAFLAYLISEHIGGLALYPAAFGILVLSRAYGVARSAAVPRLIPQNLGLSEAGARASVFGTLAGAVAVPIGIGGAFLGPQWSLRFSTAVFLFGMVTALRLPPRADADPPETVPRLFRRPGHRGVKILTGRVVLGSLVGSASLRLLYGFLTLYLAFAIRADGLPDQLLAWTLSQGAALGVVAGALGLGSFLATAVGAVLNIRRPALVQAIGLACAGCTAVAAAAHPDLLAVTVLCLVTALASGLAKLAVDAVLQESIDERVRASAFAHSETLLMIAWVCGGALGLAPFPGRWGLITAAALAGLGAVRGLAAVFPLRGRRVVRLHGKPQHDPAPEPAPEPTPDPAPLDAAPRSRRPADRGTTTPLPPWTGGGDDLPVPAAPPPRPRVPDTGAPEDLDDTTIHSPGFHLYRPTGLDSPDDQK